MRTARISIALCSLAITSVGHAEEPADAKVYSGPEGLEVAVVHASGKAFVRVLHSGSELDGKAFAATADENGDSANFHIQLHGRDYNLLYARHGHWEVSLPKHRDSVKVTWDEKHTQALKPIEIIQLNQKQTADGSLAALAKFDRAGESAIADRTLAASAQEFNTACGGKVPVKMIWTGVSDEVLMHYSLVSYCGEVLSELGKLCASDVGKAAVQASVKAVNCQIAPALALTIDKSGTLTFGFSTESSNLADYAKDALASQLGPSAPPGASPFSDPSLKGQMFVEKTVVCADTKNHYVVLAPDDSRGHRIFSGDGKTLTGAALPGKFLPSEDFLDPRFVNRTANSNFRGYDMRIHGSVEVVKDKCQVRCGERVVELAQVDAATRKTILANAKIAEPFNREPYSMARDERGNYYYVDHGTSQELEKNFRLFVGPKGNLKLQKMTNVVSDSEGEIFSTKTGSLRFIFSAGQKTETVWIEKKARTSLIQVQVKDNLPLIYNELGVYSGQRLGTPCDDL